MAIIHQAGRYANCAAGPVNVFVAVVLEHEGRHSLAILFAALSAINYFCHWKPR